MIRLLIIAAFLMLPGLAWGQAGDGTYLGACKQSPPTVKCMTICDDKSAGQTGECSPLTEVPTGAAQHIFFVEFEFCTFVLTPHHGPIATTIGHDLPVLNETTTTHSIVFGDLGKFIGADIDSIADSGGTCTLDLILQVTYFK